MLRNALAVCILPWFIAAAVAAEPRAVQVTASLDKALGPMEMDRFALGQGGLSEEPIFADRIHEVRALRPRLIRLFVQEYYDLLPASGQYHWDTLDASIDMILKAGAKPLMCLAFKPRVLFPTIDQDIVEPNSYDAWEELIYSLVKHYKDRGAGIRYWEVANEPDIGEDGGSPYRFKPESYNRYYTHTVRAVLRADPDARVGGPALADSRSPLLPALLDLCEREKVPLHFVSWHIYNSDPLRIRGTIDRTRALLATHPDLPHLETFLDEWNMSLSKPTVNPRFQPCFVAEVAWQMREGGLDYSCYYHIRDYHVEQATFAKFASPYGVSLMEKWWNQMSQFDGLFDYQNHVRPVYYTFRLLSRLTGDRIAVRSSDAAVHGFGSHDAALGRYNIMLWNFSPLPAAVQMTIGGAPEPLKAQRLVLDATHPSDDENHRLRPADSFPVGAEKARAKVDLEPYGVTFLFLDKSR